MKNSLIKTLSIKEVKRIFLLLSLSAVLALSINLYGELSKKYISKIYIVEPPTNIENIIKTINTNINKINLNNCLDLNPPYNIDFSKQNYTNVLEITVFSEDQQQANDSLNKIINCSKNIISNNLVKNEYNKILSINKNINFCSNLNNNIKNCLDFYDFKNKNDRDIGFIRNNTEILDFGLKNNNSKFIYTYLLLIFIFLSLVFFIVRKINEDNK